METVLVIDDDRSVRDTVGLMLENEGFHPVMACDGQTGFQQALELKPRLILVDVVMPGLSGIEVWLERWIRCNCSRLAPTTTW
jgi:DNA-binding response OmpR family regulator